MFRLIHYNFLNGKWLDNCHLVFFAVLFFTSGHILSQDISPVEPLAEKANQFKNRVEYDSALYYYEKLGRALNGQGDERAVLLNELAICDVNILMRNFQVAGMCLHEAETEILKKFPGDSELGSTLLQVKGSYLTTSKPDSAKVLLYRSIVLRASQSGSGDTNLHYAWNKLGNLYIAKSNYDSAYICHKKALDLSLKKQNPANYLTASSYQNVGIAAQLKGDYQLAESCYTKSLELKEKLFTKNDPALAKIYWNLGKFYTDLSKYDIALEYYDKAELMLSTRYNKDNFQYGHIYWNKGNVYTHKGDYVKATSYLSKAHSILESTYGPDNQDVYKVLLDLGFAYEKKGDTILAIEYYQLASKNKEDAGNVKIYRNLGNIYMEKHEQDSSEKYYNAAIESAKRIFTGFSYDLALCYQYYGEFLAKSKKDERALYFYSQAAEIFIQLFGGKNKDLSKVYRLQSEFFLEIHEYDSALIKNQASLVALLPEFSSFDIYINPSKDEFILDIYLLETLVQKAFTLHQKFIKNNSYKDLKTSLDLIDLSFELTEEKRRKLNEQESQIILNNLATNVFDLGVIVSLDLFNNTNDSIYLYKSFNYSEKGQAITLLSALRGLEVQSAANIPASLKARENSITKELATYNSFLYQERQKKMQDQAKMQFWSNEIFNLSQSHDSILSIYKQYHPEYFRLKFDYTSISADTILSTLGDDQAILEYCLTNVPGTDSVVIGYLLTDNILSAKTLGKKSDLNLMLDSMRLNFTGNDFLNAGKKELDEIAIVGNELYNFLVRPFEKSISGKRLIIVPDGELGYLSFDLLIPEIPVSGVSSYQDLPWLIKSNPISYSSSATIYFEQMQQLVHNTNNKVLAFAPSYGFTSSLRNATAIDSARLKLNPMVGTKEEIEIISGYFNSKKLIDKEATETYFKDHAGKYGILHLAMHTIIDDQNPLYSKLVFTPSETDTLDDGYLNTYELFNMQLTGRLAVLSACNTGGGKLERGEGIISLARGFFYAGIPSVVMTLWEIEDQSSADLMGLFYQNLKAGYPNDVALQMAKVSYLEKAGKLLSHPYFWAGYVNIGKTDPIRFNSGNQLKSFIYVGISALLLIVLLIIFINRRVFFHKKRY